MSSSHNMGNNKVDLQASLQAQHRSKHINSCCKALFKRKACKTSIRQVLPGSIRLRKPLRRKLTYFVSTGV